MITEVFVGRYTRKLKKDFIGIPGPHPEIRYEKSGKGVHHKDALDGITARIQPNSENPVGPPHLGCYEAKVEIWIPEMNDWKVKGMSTFFPDDFTRQRLIEELSMAYTIKNAFGKKDYVSRLSNGIPVMFRITNGNITTVHPFFLKK